MRNPPILIAVIGFFAALAGFGYLFFGLRVLGFDWFGALGDLPAFESVGIWGWLAVIVGIIWIVAALGLWALQPWARTFAIIVAGISLIEAALAFFQYTGIGIGLAMAIMPLLILWYLSTAEVKEAFGLLPEPSTVEPPDPVEPQAPAAVAMATPSAPASATGVAAAAAVAETTSPEVVPSGDADVPDAPSRVIRIEDVEGIGPAFQAKLADIGISTTGDLLAAGSTRAGREHIAQQTGISHAQILEWVNNADLMRVPGVGTQYSDLLEAAGVDSPAELANRNAANLAQTFQEVVAARPGTVRRIPTEAEIAGWIEAAALLPKVVEH